MNDEIKTPKKYDGVMRIDLLKKWLKMFPYGYCDGMNYATCRANEGNCPYCKSGVDCSDGEAAKSYYREILRFQRLRPKKAAKIAVNFAECLPSILRSLDTEIERMEAADD